MEKKTESGKVRKKSKKEKNIRIVVSLVLSFILALCITAIIVLTAFKMSFFNASSVIGEFNKTNYYYSVWDSVYEKACNTIRPSGLPEEVLDGVFDKNVVYMESKNYIEAQIKQQDYTVNTTVIENKIKDNISSYIKKNNIETTKETDRGISDITGEIIKDYESALKFPFAAQYVKYMNMYNKVFAPLCAVLVILCIIICFVLVSMQHWAHRGIRYISYALLSSGIMGFLAPAVIRISGAYERLNVTPLRLYNLVVAVIESNLNMLMYLSCAAFVLFGLSLGAINTLKQRASHKR